MSTFSERYGYSQVRRQLQHDDMDGDYRVAIWNAFHLYSRDLEGVASSNAVFYVRLWAHFWKRPLDELPLYGHGLSALVKKLILTGKFNQVYDLIEFVISNFKGTYSRELEEVFDGIMTRFLAPYRIVHGVILKVDQDSDVEAIEQALDDTESVPGARRHLERALSHLADRTNPDYANSVKESISAIESVCRLLSGKSGATLGDALKALKAKGVTIHSSLERGWLAIYGYTSDAEGIRHAASVGPTVSQAEARYFLVSCSAFASLLIHMAHQVELLEAEGPGGGAA